MSNVISTLEVQASTGKAREDLVRYLDEAKQKASEVAKSFSDLEQQSLATAKAANAVREAKQKLSAELSEEKRKIDELNKGYQAEREQLALLQARLLDLQRAKKQEANVTSTGTLGSPKSFALDQSIGATTDAIKKQQDVVNAYGNSISQTNDHVARLDQLHKSATSTLKEHDAAQRNVNVSKKEAATAIKQVNGEIRTAKVELNQHDRALQESERATNRLTTGQIAMAEVLGRIVYNALRTVTTGIIDFIKESVIYASRTDEMRIAMENMGRVTGHTSGEIAAHENAIKSLNITTQQARETLTKFMLADLDLGKASQLARVAQDLAVVVGVDTSEELERLTRGISTLQIRTLRTAGVFVNLLDAEKDVARQTGRSITSFSEAEKQTILLNQVLEFGARANGTYGESLENAGKRMRSMNRIFAEMQNAIGGLLQGPFANLIDSLSGLMKIIAAAPQVSLTIVSVLGTVALSLGINAIATTRWGLSLETLTLNLIRATGAARVFGVTAAVTGAEQAVPRRGAFGLGGLGGALAVAAAIPIATEGANSLLSIAGATSRYFKGTTSLGGGANEEEIRQKLTLIKVNNDDVASINRVVESSKTQGEASLHTAENLIKVEQAYGRLLPQYQKELQGLGGSFDARKATIEQLGVLTASLDKTNEARQNELFQMLRTRSAQIESTETITKQQKVFQKFQDQMEAETKEWPINKLIRQTNESLLNFIGTLSTAGLNKLFGFNPGTLQFGNVDNLEQQRLAAKKVLDEGVGDREAFFKAAAEAYIQLSKNDKTLTVSAFEEKVFSDSIRNNTKAFAENDDELQRQIRLQKDQQAEMSGIAGLRKQYDNDLDKARKLNLSFDSATEAVTIRLGALKNVWESVGQVINEKTGLILNQRDALIGLKSPMLALDRIMQDNALSQDDYNEQVLNAEKIFPGFIELVIRLKSESSKSIKGVGDDAAEAGKHIADTARRVGDLRREVQGLLGGGDANQQAAANLEMTQRRLQIIKGEIDNLNTARTNLNRDVGQPVPVDREQRLALQNTYETAIKVRDEIRAAQRAQKDFIGDVVKSQQLASTARQDAVSAELIAAKMVADNQIKRVQTERQITAEIIALTKERADASKYEADTQKQAFGEFYKSQLEGLMKTETGTRELRAELAFMTGEGVGGLKLPQYNKVNPTLENISTSETQADNVAAIKDSVKNIEMNTSKGVMSGTLQGGAQKIFGFQPTFNAGLNNLLGFLSSSGAPATIASGVRTAEQQRAAFDKGLPTPFTGGVGSMSAHQLGLAADLHFKAGQREQGIALINQWVSAHPEYKQAGIVRNRFGVPIDDRTHVQLGSSRAINSVTSPQFQEFSKHGSELVTTLSGSQQAAAQRWQMASQNILGQRIESGYEGSSYQSARVAQAAIIANAQEREAALKTRDELKVIGQRETADWYNNQTYKDRIFAATELTRKKQLIGTHDTLLSLINDENTKYRENAIYKTLITNQAEIKFREEVNRSKDDYAAALADRQQRDAHYQDYLSTIHNNGETSRLRFSNDAEDKLNALLDESNSGWRNNIAFRLAQWRGFESARIEATKNAEDHLAELNFQISHVHDNDNINVATARTQAILDVLSLDNKAEQDMAGNAIRLADAQIYHAGRSNAQIINFLMQQKSVDTIVADARIGVMQSFFNAIDTGLGKITSKLGVFGDLVKQVVGDLAKFAITKYLGAGILGVPTGGNAGGNTGGILGGLQNFIGGSNSNSTFNTGNVGGGSLTGVFNAGLSSVNAGFGNGLNPFAGNLFGGGYQTLPVSSSLPSGVTNLGADLPLGSPTNWNNIFSVLPGSSGASGGTSLGSAMGIAGLLKGIGPALGISGIGLGAQLGAGLGGQSGVGSVLGGLGGGLAGLGLIGGLSASGILGGALGGVGTLASGASAGLFGLLGLGGLSTSIGSISSLGALAPLLSFAIPAAIIAAPLIIGAVLLARNKKRRAAEQQRAALIGDSLSQLQQLLQQVQRDKIGGAEAVAQAAGIRETYVKNAQAITDSKTRNIALQDVSRLDAVIVQIKAAANAQDKRRQMDDLLKPEFAGGGLVSLGRGFSVPGTDMGYDNVSAMLRPGEVVLNRQQQEYLGGARAMSSAGVPGFSNRAYYNSGGYARSNVSSNLGNIYLVTDRAFAEKMAVQGRDKILSLASDSIVEQSGPLYRSIRTV